MENKDDDNEVWLRCANNSRTVIFNEFRYILAYDISNLSVTTDTLFPK